MRVCEYGCDNVHIREYMVCVCTTHATISTKNVAFLFILFYYITDDDLFAPLVNMS